MKTTAVILALVAGMGLAPTVGWAEVCRSDQKLNIIGSVATNTGVISTSAHEVRLINVTCGGTACIAGLYDTTTVALAAEDVTGNTYVKIEPGAPASQSKLVPDSGFFEQPLTFGSGIVFIDDQNVASVSLYECVQR